MKTTKSRISLVSLLLALLMLCGSFVAVPVSAVSLDSELEKREDILWELDFAKMSTVDDNLGNPGYTIDAPKSINFYEIDGQKCLGFKNSSGSYFINDVDNILKDYEAYYMEADMYFESYPSSSGTSGDTPRTYPMSFMTWLTIGDTGDPAYGSIRIDDEGYLCTKASANSRLSSTAKLPLGEWFNIRFVVSPSGRRCEVFVNHESVGSYGINMKKNSDITASRLRFFDGRYSYSVYFKNISVTSNADYRIGLSKETSADYLGYQTTKVEDGKFDIRLLSTMSSMDFQTAGYTVYRLTDDFGEAFVEEFVLKSKQVYESVNQTSADGTTMARKASEFGTKYLSAITLTDMSVNENATIVVRPWVMTDGVKTYGTPQKLIYAGIVTDGYPSLSRAYEATQYELTATEDTYTGGKYQNSSDTSPHGSELLLDLKTAADKRSNLHRQAYIKFTLPEKAIEMIAGAYQVRLEFCGRNVTSRTPQEIADGGPTAIISGVDTQWTEAELTKATAETTAKVYEELGKVVYKTKQYAAVDVTEFARKNAVDGELAFQIENEFVNEYESTLYSREAEGGIYAPRLVIVPSNLSLNYEVSLGKLQNIGYEPWGYAEQLVNEWFDGGERDKVYSDEYEPLNLERVDNNTANGDYSVYNPLVNSTKNAYVRTLSTLSGYKMEEKTLYDEFGGIMNLGIKGRATGYFHTERIDGKVYIIDPIGNPYFALAVNTINHGSTANQKKLTIEQYGSEEEFYEEVAKDMLGNFGINSTFSSGATANVELMKNGMTVVVGTGGINSYMGSLGLSVSTGGSAAFFYNDTMNVFDPDFIPYADGVIKAAVTPYVNEQYLLGYTSDNEIPGGDDILERYLTIPSSEPVNAFSYATAWTWFCRATESYNPSLDELTPEMNQEFLAFVYNRYFKIISESIKKYDPNHMYIGTRAHTPTKDKEGFLRAAAQYLDVITTNLYGSQNYATINTVIDKIYQYSGLPIIVSEFGMRALDSVDMNGYKLGNTGSTACWLFETQQQRANSYESYVLNLLESNNCVGWVLYRFRDNDQSIYEDAEGNKYFLSSVSSAAVTTYTNIETGVKIEEGAKELTKVYAGETDTSNINHNKGIYDNRNQPYPEMRDSMKAISENLASLVKFFAK